MTERRIGRFHPASLLFAAWLVLLWVLLWGGPTWANLFTGVLVSGAVLWAVPREAPSGDGPVFHPIAAASLLFWFLWKLLDANIRVAIEVLRPPGRGRIRTAIIAVDLPGAPPAVATSVANLITLTPGTLTLDVDPATPTLYVHVLQLTDPETVRADVLDIERRVVAAYGSRSSRAAVDGREVSS
jgi:multicomponent Na+:H+ antiporter subunit E